MVGLHRSNYRVPPGRCAALTSVKARGVSPAAEPWARPCRYADAGAWKTRCSVTRSSRGASPTWSAGPPIRTPVRRFNLFAVEGLAARIDPALRSSTTARHGSRGTFVVRRGGRSGWNRRCG